MNPPYRHSLPNFSKLRRFFRVAGCQLSLFGCLLGISLGAGASGGVPKAAQSSEKREVPAGRELFFEHLDVNLVNVEVYVTDRDGEPVRGLSPQDFRVYEDGREMKLTNFYAVEGGRRQSHSDTVAGAPSSIPEEGGGGSLELLPIPEDQRLHLIILFDNLHLRPFSRNRVVGELRQFLDRNLGPDDRTMVVTYERTLNIRQPFSSDPRRLEAALHKIEKMTGFAQQKDSERRQVIRRIESTDNLLEAESHVDFYAKDAFNDLTRSIDGMKQLVASLSGLPGRKALLYVSDGLPAEAAQDLFLLLDQKFTHGVAGELKAARYGVRSELRELVAQANSNRVTFYTLEATGLRSHSSLSAESGGTQSGGSFLDLDIARAANEAEPLQLMADGTGGRAVFGSNNISRALGEMKQDFDSYYSLGYTPGHSGDGRYYRIEVKLEKKGKWTVRHRSGYRDKTAESRLADGTLAALLYAAENNPVGVSFELGSPRPRGDGTYLVGIEVKVPIGALTLVPQGGEHRGRFKVSLAVMDDEEGTSPPDLAPLSLSIPDRDLATARLQNYVYAVDLLMRKGLQTVAVGFRDELSGTTSFVRKPVPIGL